MIDGIIRMMATPDDFLGPVNLGNPREFTILELAERLIRMTGSRAKIIFKPLPQDDPAQRKPDIRMARETLGWQPKIPLEEGIEKTIAYFRKVL
jgi:UDP-glucuronate decarboxylase